MIIRKKENNGNWKGGKPYCVDCNKQLASYTAKRCHSCSSKKSYKKRMKNGYPMSNKKHSKKSREQMKKSREKYLRQHPNILKGKNNPMFGRKGKLHPRFNVSLSKEIKEKIGKANKGKLKGKNNPNWQNGISKLPYAFEFTNDLKDQIRKRDNYKCQNCGMTEEEHIIVYGTVLCVHHIDYDKKNYNKRNLITLCNQCNTRVNFNRNYWFSYFTYIMENYIYVYQKNFA